MRILLIEDDPKVSEYVVAGLSESGHVCDAVKNGRDGLFFATTETYDVVVMDRMLPQIDGLTILKTLRASGSRMPVLILSALDQTADKVEGLRAGSDDYLAKPFAFSEFLARVEGLARRSTNQGREDTRLTAQDLDMDLLARKVSRKGQIIDLQTREFRLLEFLLRRKGQVVTRTMLLEGVWDYYFDPQTNVIDVHISRLRAKVDKGSAIPLIKTVRGAGYIIEN